MKFRWKLAAIFALIPVQLSAGNSVPDQYIGEVRVINSEQSFAQSALKNSEGYKSQVNQSPNGCVHEQTMPCDGNKQLR